MVYINRDLQVHMNIIRRNIPCFRNSYPCQSDCSWNRDQFWGNSQKYVWKWMVYGFRNLFLYCMTLLRKREIPRLTDSLFNQNVKQNVVKIISIKLSGRYSCPVKLEPLSTVILTTSGFYPEHLYVWTQMYAWDEIWWTSGAAGKAVNRYVDNVHVNWTIHIHQSHEEQWYSHRYHKIWYWNTFLSREQWRI